MPVTRVTPKVRIHKSGEYTYRKVYKGRTLFGELRKYPHRMDQIYWALRKPDEIFIKTNSWAIDVETLQVLAPYCIKEIGIAVNNGDTYLTTRDKFAEPYAVQGNFEGHMGAKKKGGALQWYLPIRYFKCELAPVVTRTLSAAKLMMVSTRL